MLGAMLATPAFSVERLQGAAKIFDGDTIEVEGQRIRLHGIDAPETDQKCFDAREKSYACGKQAVDALRKLIRGQPVTCTGKIRDEYDRLIAVCETSKTNLNREMVENGWAVAFKKYSEDYLEQEIDALKRGLGIWRGQFQRPFKHRAKRWQVEKQVAPEGCPIKGNINGKGVKIYHAPWSQYYSRTKISTDKGERWFCNELDAIKAGWRAPYR
jgi:endonuclease YncB( thermonuclease family)